MGAWGPGNLENDGAQDELVDVCERLFNELIELLQDPCSHQYDEVEIDRLFVRIEMIFALHQGGILSFAPSLEVLDPHLEPYIERWNEYQQDEGNGEWPERRAVIEATFDKLRAIASGAPKDALSHRWGLISAKMAKPD